MMHHSASQGPFCFAAMLMVVPVGVVKFTLGKRPVKEGNGGRLEGFNVFQ